MNKSFMLLDRNNNLEKEAREIIRFSFEENNYLVYSVPENEQNSQIFVSKLIVNSEGKNFIDNILPEEKNKLSNIVYNIIILLPTDVQKGNDFQMLVDNLVNKFSVKLLNGLPDMAAQEYYNNCSIAITNKILVENAINLYSDKLNKKVEEVKNEVPMWTAPTEVIVPVPVDENLNKIEEPVINTVTMPVQEQASIDVKSETVVGQVQEPVTNDVIVPGNVDSTSNTSLDNEVEIANPQIQKLAIVSDPSLGIGVQQPNMAKNEKAGFANTKYVVIGSICLFLAIAVIVAAYILIKNMG